MRQVRRSGTRPGSTCRAGRVDRAGRAISARGRATRDSARGWARRACWPRARPQVPAPPRRWCGCRVRFGERCVEGRGRRFGGARLRLAATRPRCRERARLLAAAAGQPARLGCRERGSAAPELAPGGFRRGDARGVATRAAPAGVRRAGQEGARRTPGLHSGGGREPGCRSRPEGAAASRLSGARRVDGRAARGDPHPGRRQPRGASTSVLRWRPFHGRVRRKRRASGRESRRIQRRLRRSHTGPRRDRQWRERNRGALAAGPTAAG